MYYLCNQKHHGVLRYRLRLYPLNLMQVMLMQGDEYIFN